jgi:hypothetical protein
VIDDIVEELENAVRQPILAHYSAVAGISVSEDTTPIYQHNISDAWCAQSGGSRPA